MQRAAAQAAPCTCSRSPAARPAGGSRSSAVARRAAHALRGTSLANAPGTPGGPPMRSNLLVTLTLLSPLAFAACQTGTSTTSDDLIARCTTTTTTTATVPIGPGGGSDGGS